MRNLHTKTFSRNRRRTKHGRASRIHRRDREGSNKNKYMYILKNKQKIKEHPTAIFTENVGTYWGSQ